MFYRLFPCIFGLIAALTLGLAAPGFAAPVALPGQYEQPIAVASLPDGSLIVAQSTGQIDRVLPDATPVQEPMPWADLGGAGVQLLGIAVDPDYATNGTLYATLQIQSDEGFQIQVTRWKWTEGSLILNAVLVDHLPGGPERTGGVIKIGPDRKIWVGLGDGAAVAADVTPTNLRGVLLRYNLDGSIPADNPGGSAVWASGFREPSGLAWHPVSGQLYVLDRGPVIPRGTMDELDLVEKGAFYGWPKYLGRDSAKGLTKPVIYCSSGHSWIPGGAIFLTKGENTGALVFAGAGQGILYRLSMDAKTPAKINFYDEQINGALGALVDVTENPDGYVFLLSKSKLYRLDWDR